MSATIKVEDVSMEFRLVHERSSDLKEAVVRALRRQRSKVEQFVALDGVRFEVGRKGEALGIIGHNGSGKTTLLRLLAGVMTPTRGRIEIDGRITTLIDLGAGFNPYLSGEENVVLTGALYGFPRAEMRKRLPEIVEFAELDRFIEVPVKNYSSGMKCTARVLHRDERGSRHPGRGRGARGRRRGVPAEVLRTHEQSFRDRKKTIVLVSHDLGTDREVLRPGAPAGARSDRRRGSRPAEVTARYRG